MERQSSSLQTEIKPHDTAIWKIRPAAGCGVPARTGVITRLASGHHRDAESYTLCLAASGRVEACSGSSGETWTVTRAGALQSSGQCLTVSGAKVLMRACNSQDAQNWRFDLMGNLINRRNHLCLTGSQSQGLTAQTCGHNLASQIWSLPNARVPQ